MSRLGLMILGRYPSELMAEFALFAEEHGWDSVWLPEGLWKDPLVELGFIATKTSRIRIATGIATIYNRTPATMAQAALALSDLSKGRFTLGLGVGHQDRTHNIHGTHIRKPLASMRDYVSIVRQGTGSQLFDYSGEVFSVKAMQHMYEAPYEVPIYIACLGPQMSRLSGEIAEGAILHLATAKSAQRIRAQAEDGARNVGRDATKLQVVANIIANAPKDHRKAREEMKHELAMYAKWPAYRAELGRAGFGEEAERMRQAWEKNDPVKVVAQISEGMMRELPIAVGEEEMWEKVQRHWNHGVDVASICLRPLESDPIRSIRETLDRFVRSK